jgi:4-amino-4-deoxychorismate mutase
MTEKPPQEQLEALRGDLNALDNKLVALIAERLSICAKVGDLKSRNGIPMMQNHRVREVKRRAAALGARNGLREEFVEALFDLIIREACDLEDRIIAGHAQVPK